MALGGIVGHFLDKGFLALGHDPYFVLRSSDGPIHTSWGRTIALFLIPFGYLLWKVFIKRNDDERG